MHIIDIMFVIPLLQTHGSEVNVLRKLQPRSTWYLTGLGSLATTQREYVALHAFRRLNVQVMYINLSSFLFTLLHLILT